MITLQSERLRVELADPGEAPNTTTRFDRAGFVTEVILDGTMRFCASEPQNIGHPSSGGRGLCSELCFDISRETPMGAQYPKLGVGLIRKEVEGPYRYDGRYDNVTPFAVAVQHTGDRAVYTTEPLPCQGYAVRTTKTVAVAGNRLIVEMQLENTGEKALRIEEYNHNFLSIDGMALGSDYTLDMPMVRDCGTERLYGREGALSSFRGNGRGLTFCEFSALATAMSFSQDEIVDIEPFSWKLSHRGARASVQGTEYFRPGSVVVWAIDHMVCPEVFCAMEVAPGARRAWKREWVFEREQ